jgi:hypothetical protein
VLVIIPQHSSVPCRLIRSECGNEESRADQPRGPVQCARV